MHRDGMFGMYMAVHCIIVSKHWYAYGNVHPSHLDTMTCTETRMKWVRLRWKITACFCFADGPENVILTTNTTSKVCTGVVINFTCIAKGNPPVHTYLLYENEIMIKNMGIIGS